MKIISNDEYYFIKYVFEYAIDQEFLGEQSTEMMRRFMSTEHKDFKED